MQCYLHLTNDGQNSTSAPGQGTIHAGSNGTATLTNVAYDEWIKKVRMPGYKIKSKVENFSKDLDCG